MPMNPDTVDVALNSSNASSRIRALNLFTALPGRTHDANETPTLVADGGATTRQIRRIGREMRKRKSDPAT
jgi:hypothetical protein